MQQFIHLLKDKPATQAFLTYASQAYNQGLLSPVIYDQLLTGLKLSHRPQGQAINSLEPEGSYSDQDTLIYILLYLLLRQQELSGSTALKHSDLLQFFKRWNQLLILARTLNQCVTELNIHNLGLLLHLPYTFRGDQIYEHPTTQVELIEQFKLYTLYQQQLFSRGYNFYALELENLALHFLSQASHDQLEGLIPQIQKLPVRFINTYNISDVADHTLLPHLLQRELQVPFAANVATSNSILGQNYYSYLLAAKQSALQSSLEAALQLDLSNRHQAIGQAQIHTLAQQLSNTFYFNSQACCLPTTAYLLASNFSQLQDCSTLLAPELSSSLSNEANLQQLSLTNNAFRTNNPNLQLKIPLSSETPTTFRAVNIATPSVAWLHEQEQFHHELGSAQTPKLPWDFATSQILQKFNDYRQSLKSLIFSHKNLLAQLEQHRTLAAIPENLQLAQAEYALTPELLASFNELYQQPVDLTLACLATILRPTLRYTGNLTVDFDWDAEHAPEQLEQLVKQLLNNTYLKTLQDQHRNNRKIVTFIKKQPYQPHNFIDRFVAEQFYTRRFMSFTTPELTQVFTHLAQKLISFEEFNLDGQVVRFLQQAWELFTQLSQPIDFENFHTGKLNRLLATMHNLNDWTNPSNPIPAQEQHTQLGLISVINTKYLDTQSTQGVMPFVVQRELVTAPEQAKPEYFWSLSRAHRLETEIYQQLKKRVYDTSEMAAYGISETDLPFSLEQLKAQLFKFITIYRENRDNFGEQELAIASAMHQNFSCIIGGPGSGKTTTVFNILLLNAILFIACSKEQQASPQIELMAPTGKAAEGLTKSIHAKAQAFSEYLHQLEAGTLRNPQAQAQWQLLQEQFLPNLNSIAHQALQAILATFGQTIHKTFGINQHRRLGLYSARNPHQAELIIVDEVGMVNLEILHKVICYANPHAKIIFLGDADQLPSIELGDTLAVLSNQPRFISPQRQAKLQNYGFKLKNFLSLQPQQNQLSDAQTKLIQVNPLLSKVVAEHNLATIADNIHTLVHIYRFTGNLRDYAYAINGRSQQTHSQALRTITQQLATSYIAQQATVSPDETQRQFVAHYAKYGSKYQELASQIFAHASNLSYESNVTGVQGEATSRILQFNRQYLGNELADMNLQYYEPLYLGYLLIVRQLLAQAPQLLLRDKKQGMHSQAQEIVYDLVSCLAITSQQELQACAKNPSYIKKLRMQIQKRSLELLNQGLRYLEPSFNAFLQNLILRQTYLRFRPLMELLQAISSCQAQGLESELNQLINQAFAELQQVRFLSPVRDGVLGVDTLNELFIQRYNKNFAQVVMVTRNSPEHQLVNGQLGILTNENNLEVVYFRSSTDDKPHRVLKSQVPEFEYAYFTTIHKSQGDEFTQTHVILPRELHGRNISRALYFTAVTRVKKHLVIYSRISLQQITEFAQETRTTSLNFCWDYQRLLDANFQVAPQELASLKTSNS